MIRQSAINIIFFLVASLLLNLTAQGQNFHYSNLHENLFKFNPSLITGVEKMSFQLTYRNQWPGSSNFVTYDASAVFTSERLKSSFGGHIFHDVQGGDIITHTSFGLLYAFKTRIYREWEASGGLAGSVNISNINLNALTFENDPSTSVTGGNSYYGNFAAGLHVAYRNEYTFGFSLSNIASPYIEENSLPGLQFNFSAQGRFLLTRHYSQITTYFEPVIWVSASGSGQEALYGGRLNFSGILAGLYIRQGFDFTFDALSLLLGTQIGSIAFYYNYDINLSGASGRFSNLAAHEVTFLYLLEYKRTSKKRRGAIKCPDI